MWRKIKNSLFPANIWMITLLILIALFLVIFKQEGFLLVDQRGIFMEYAYNPLSTRFGNTIEYPAGAFLFFKLLTIPTFLFKTFFKNQLQAYYFFLSISNVIAYISIWILTIKMAQPKSRIQIHAINIFFFACFFVAHPYLLLSTFDLIPTAITLAAIMLAPRKPYTSGILLALATTIKWFPGLLFPYFLWLAWKEKKIHIKYGLTFLGTLFVIHLLTLIWIPFSIQQATYTFHANRGIHAESLAGNILLLTVPSSNIVYANHSLEIADVNATALTTGIWYVWISLIALSIFLGIRHGRDAHAWAMRISGTTILAFIIFNKVFSPQFLFWMITFFVYEIGTTSHKRSWILAALTGTALFLGPLLTLHQEEFVAQSTMSILTLTVRNLIILGIFGYLFLTLYPSPASPRIPKED